jgi:23S rRNA-/tRNA-specific pseudouridylate synthase
LETGRTHQIRVHLGSIGLPILGDEAYGRVRPELGPQRPFLHSARLSFVHPFSGEELNFESALPEDLQSVLDRFEPAES